LRLHGVSIVVRNECLGWQSFWPCYRVQCVIENEIW
jgi:hypothetical protein